MIYLDYSANTPADPAVLEVFVRTENSFGGNPNSSHPAGLAAKEKLEQTTGSIADLLEIQASEVIYTSGASEANNLAVKGIARAQRNYGKHIISTALEHPSVSGPLTWLQEQGYEIDLADIRRDGKIDTDHLRELLRDDTVLVAQLTASSELSSRYRRSRKSCTGIRTAGCMSTLHRRLERSRSHFPAWIQPASLPINSTG